MSLTPSRMLTLGTKAPEFNLPDPYGTVFSLKQLALGKPLHVVFMCNHCPYVKHIKYFFAKLARDYQAKGVAIVGINANDYSVYPEVNPVGMKKDAEQFKIKWKSGNEPEYH